MLNGTMVDSTFVAVGGLRVALSLMSLTLGRGLRQLASHPAKLRGLNPISLSCEIELREFAQGAHPKGSRALGWSVVFAFRLVEDK